MSYSVMAVGRSAKPPAMDGQRCCLPCPPTTYANPITNAGLGLVPMVPEQFLAEKATEVGGFVQQILDVYDRNVNSRDTAVKLSSCSCISWQWPLHLAFLQANALPKSTAHGDRFLLLPSRTIPDLVLVEYLYNDTRLGGGRDPLACATEEVSWPNNNSPQRSPNNGMTKASYATAAAYTVLRGCCVDDGISSGMDAAVTAACLARSRRRDVARQRTGLSDRRQPGRPHDRPGAPVPLPRPRHSPGGPPTVPGLWVSVMMIM
jgi:hypothetical protein